MSLPQKYRWRPLCESCLDGHVEAYVRVEGDPRLYGVCQRCADEIGPEDESSAQRRPGIAP